MAFVRLDKPKPMPLFIRFTRRANGATSFKLSTGLYESLGSPRAIHFEWDDDGSLIRIVAANPGDSGSYRICTNGEYTITDLIDAIGVSFLETTRVPTTSDGPLAAIADLSEYRSAA